MTENASFARSISIRDAGKGETWLGDQVCANPSCLGLGELEVIGREWKQSSSGRIDILLKNPSDDTMYEVEMMLGETDPSHIVRTIEYWDNEKRRWPQRKHIAVLIAEDINKRFFNVIYLLSNCIPIIAIKVSMVEVQGKQALFFTKILNTYEEIDDGTSNIETTREDWIKLSGWTLETADHLLGIISNVFEGASLNFTKSYISIVFSENNYNYFWFKRKDRNKSLLGFRINDITKDKIIELLELNNISYTEKPDSFSIIIDKDFIEQNKNVFIKLAEIVKKNRTRNGN